MLRSRVLNILSPAAALCLPAMAGAQALYSNGASITITNGGSLTVRGNLTNAASGAVCNNGTLTVSGNTVNDGTFSATSTNTLRLTGTLPQTLGGTAPINADDVELNNPAGIVLNTRLNVDGAITFTSGVITAASSATPVVFGTNATIANTPTDGSHIDGYVQKNGAGSFIFPVGDATKYQPVAVNLSVNSGGMVARYVAGNAGNAPYGNGGSSPTPLLYRNTREYWDLSPTGTAAGSVTVYFDAYNNTGISNVSDLRVAHLRGGAWQNEGGLASGTATAGTITSNSISAWSPFTLGSISVASPLPVRLMAFRAHAAATTNQLEWQTADETPGAVIVVERSADGRSFDAIATLQGTGDFSSYRFDDPGPLPPVSYYRLKLTEPGVSASYSQIAALRRSGSAVSAVQVFPMPAGGSVTISCAGDDLIGSRANVLDVHGRIIATVQIAATSTLDISSWPAGTYILRLADGESLKLSKR